jgi:hypothetical protein
MPDTQELPMAIASVEMKLIVLDYTITGWAEFGPGLTATIRRLRRLHRRETELRESLVFMISS